MNSQGPFRGFVLFGEQHIMIVLGAMSGTSTDGIDVAALEFDAAGVPLQCLAHLSFPFETNLRDLLLRLQEVPGTYNAGEDPFALMLEARRQLTDAYRTALLALMTQCGLTVAQVAAVGVHGQTLRHRPDRQYTHQMFDPARLAVQIACPVVADFRSADVALGGQGAPLVPPFHAAWIAQRVRAGAVGVLNLGGFSNLTAIDREGKVQGGGDCGPASVLMDYWARTRFNRDFDHSGEIASEGAVAKPLLALLKQHPYFARPWPKSTGRDDFTSAWLEQYLQAYPALSAEDVMSTLLQLTVDSVVDCTKGFSLSSLFVCGGGANNIELMRRLGLEISPCRVASFEELGLAPEAVEAAAFAWLACRRLLRLASNCSVVTGSSRELSLGGLYLP
ncbi:anhydro-N-acetylmuramic acid kinase [Limnobacter litoralis]|uniref:Anhydro-N-acetylmuramic acid kinase n=1 Tax=Limnobacter litoralis TaxID=481366 RepID=A0ABQ5YUX1_9BURK|nr:anhydro-N-acetylmuramic acid kinase [Limnobacter litoralis]GLR26267.1 anhydro-N-acetylmuramic acid kinase [Limnobacter litoralis]